MLSFGADECRGVDDSETWGKEAYMSLRSDCRQGGKGRGPKARRYLICQRILKARVDLECPHGMRFGDNGLWRERWAIFIKVVELSLCIRRDSSRPRQPVCSWRSGLSGIRLHIWVPLGLSLSSWWRRFHSPCTPLQVRSRCCAFGARLCPVCRGSDRRYVGRDGLHSDMLKDDEQQRKDHKCFGSRRGRWMLTGP